MSYEHLKRARGVTSVRNDSDAEVDGIDHCKVIRVVAVTEVLQRNSVKRTVEQGWPI